MTHGWGFSTTQMATQPVGRGRAPSGCVPVGPCPANATNLSPGSASICVDDNAAKYLPSGPFLVKTNADGDTAAYAFTAQRLVTENFFTIRGDDKISDKDSLRRYLPA